MVGKGEGAVTKLDNQIAVMKYLLLFTNLIVWMLAAAIFALCMWIRFEPGFEEWIDILGLQIIYIGPYILIVISVIAMIVSFLGCLGALQENTFTMYIYIGTQLLTFIGGVAGTALLLDNTTQNSNLQPIVKESMRRMIMNAQYGTYNEYLNMIQENIACCGADGPMDYIELRQPLPNQCRDTVTGNAFFHGCVQELTWFFEEKCAWIAALAMTACMFHVVNIVVTFVLVQAIKKEENEQDTYRR